MSYENLTGPPKEINFYYKTDDIFNIVSEATSFTAISVAKPDGTVDFDRIQITADEKTYMRKFLKEAMLDIFFQCFKLISSDSITHDSDLVLQSGGGQASGTLTLSGNLSNADTITIGTKVYTAQTTLTNVDGHFLIGSTASDTIDNLIGAIMKSESGLGTKWAALTTKNSQVTAAVGTGDTMDVKAILFGTAGNSIATTKSAANASWGGGTLSGGSGTPIIASFVRLTDNEAYRFINLDLLDQKIINALVSFILAEWYFLKGLGEQYSLYRDKFNKYLIKISEITLILRQP